MMIRLFRRKAAPEAKAPAKPPLPKCVPGVQESHCWQKLDDACHSCRDCGLRQPHEWDINEYEYDVGTGQYTWQTDGPDIEIQETRLRREARCRYCAAGTEKDTFVREHC